MQNKSIGQERDYTFIHLNLDAFRRGDKGNVYPTKVNQLVADVPPPIAQIPDVIKPYTSTLVGESGINRNQAKTCFYYAVSTHLLPDKLALMSILAVIGPLGTGKSGLQSRIHSTREIDISN